MKLSLNILFILSSIAFATSLSLSDNFFTSPVDIDTTTTDQKDGITLMVEPNPFTPNGDGINDVVSFRVEGNTHLPVIYIYRSDGKCVFSAMGPMPVWDGRDNQGRDMETGGYIYQLEVDGYIFTGVINLIR